MNGMPDANTSFDNPFVPLTTKKVIIYLMAIGCFVYFNSFFNGFVVDDLGQIVGNESIRSIVNIPDIFLNKLYAKEVSNYYRPLPYIFYTFIYTFSFGSSFLFHFVQVALHICNAILLFLIFKRFSKQIVAFMLALIFLIHPINQETVAYIANLQDVLFVLFGLFSILFLQKISTKYRWIILANVALLLSLFSKESGILFVIVSILYVYFFQRKKLLLHSLLSVSVLTMYLIIRSMVHVPFQKSALFPIFTTTLEERLLSIPSIVSYYITTLFFPQQLSFSHTSYVTSIQFTTFFLPLIIDAVFVLFLGWLSFILFKKNKVKEMFFFIAWFILGLGIHLQLIPIDMTVADHYFYFPFIGLLFLIGIVFSSIKIHFNKNILIIISITILVVLSLRTIVRNTSWYDQTTLLTHDIQVEKNDYLLELLYSTDLLQKNKTQEALPHVQKALTLYPQSWLAWSNLGVIYYLEKKPTQAKDAYKKSIEYGNYYGSYENLALLMLTYDSPESARSFIKEALQKYPNSEKLWYYRILTSYKAKDHTDALLSAREYYARKQDQESYFILKNLEQNLSLPIKN